MADVHTRETRSRNMAAIRSRDTRPERAVKLALRQLGIRYRSQYRGLPGTPDCILPDLRVALFVHGCYWHRHHGCSLAYMPKSNKAFWRAKFAANTRRDRRVRRSLIRIGWRVVVLWACRVKDARSATAALGRALARGGYQARA